MNRDPVATATILTTLGGLITQTLATLRDFKATVPESSESIDQALKDVEQLERQLQITQAQAAASLGYELCRCTFPPNIMLEVKDYQWKCPKCNRMRDIGPQIGAVML